MQTRRLRVGQLGIVLPAASPLRVGGRRRDAGPDLGRARRAGFARGCQQRWLNTLARHIHVGATRSDKTEMETLNRAALEEALEIHRPVLGGWAGSPCCSRAIWTSAAGSSRSTARRRPGAGRSLPWGESIALGGFFAMAPTMTDAQARPSRTGGPTTPGCTPFGLPKGVELVGDPDAVSASSTPCTRPWPSTRFSSGSTRGYRRWGRSGRGSSSSPPG